MKNYGMFTEEIDFSLPKLQVYWLEIHYGMCVTVFIRVCLYKVVNTCR